MDEEITAEGDPTVAEGAVARRRQAERSELARGTVIDRYVVTGKLGEGGMGVVYAAYDPDLHRRVAIKLLHPELGAGESETSGRARILREAQAMARLSDPNVIHVYDVGTYYQQVFLAVEFIEGETLARHVQRENR